MRSADDIRELQNLLLWKIEANDRLALPLAILQ
jgi:hypothetical protein